MTKEYWENRWLNREIGWHLPETNPHWLQVKDQFENISKKVLIPLCGKTLDLLWFKNHSREVWGVEIVEEAILEFFNENQLSFELTSFEGMPLYKAGNINILNSNIFEIKLDILKSAFDLVFDRGSMIALPPALRSDYARVIKWVLAERGEIFAATIRNDQRDPQIGPPHCISTEEINQTYSQLDRKILLEIKDQTDTHGQSDTVIYRLSKK